MSQFIITDEAAAGKVGKANLLTNADFNYIKNSDQLSKILKSRKRAIDKIEFTIDYESQLKKLQVELVKLQTQIGRASCRERV